MKFLVKNEESYSPLYFLAALGSGGVAITFFMYLMFMIPHKGSPIPLWENWTAVMAGDNVYLQVLTVVAIVGIVIFSIMHLYLLMLNIRAYSQFKKTGGYESLLQSNAEVQLMAIPLTLGMLINVLFILGALFVPGLWSIVEMLFPLAFLAYLSVGVYAISIFTRFLKRILTTGHFDCSRNNNLSQMLAIFAFAMIGVGFAAPAAMSHNMLMSGVSMIFSIAFMSVAGLFAITKFVLGFRSMLEHGIDVDSSVSLWITIPILTLVGITIFRLSMGMHHNFGTHRDSLDGLVLFTMLGGLQVMFGLLGYVVMKHLGYFATFISGSVKKASSYALVCPGVAGFVLAFFFVHQGLVVAGLVEKFSIAYFVLLVPLVLLQLKTIQVLMKLNFKMLGSGKQENTA